MFSAMSQNGVLNLSKQRLSDPDLTTVLHSSKENDIHTVILDDNYIRKIDNCSLTPGNLIQISIAQNQLTRTLELKRFTNLKVLNLACNLLIQLDGFEHLKDLEWVSVSGNQLRNISALNNCSKLVHIDASDNQLTNCPCLLKLVNLHTLLLHQNLISDLKSMSENAPKCIAILTLAENELSDLTQVKYLSSFQVLEQLSLSRNICLTQSNDPADTLFPTFNYRPFVINWCGSLSILDGIQVTKRESMKAEWLLSQGRGRAFNIGQHAELVPYLASVCPIITNNHKDDDHDGMKLDKIQQRRQLHSLSSNTFKQEVFSPGHKSDHLRNSQSSRQGRIPEHEKQSRVQAWLGEQPSSLKHHLSLNNYHTSKSNLPPDFITLNRGYSIGDNESEPKCSAHDRIALEDTANASLLMSESEFVTGEDLAHNLKVSAMGHTSGLRHSPQKSQGIPKTSKTRKCNIDPIPNSGYGSLALIQKHYDSPVTTPSTETERWAYKTTKAVDVPLPATTVKEPLTVQMLDAALGTVGEVHESAYDDTDVSMSKYEEYEMRPIKPLNTDLQMKMYGPNSLSSPHLSTRQRPPPLKKNTGATSKHAVTGLRKSICTKEIITPTTSKVSVKKQSNMAMKKISSPMKKEHIGRVAKPSSPHRKRQQNPQINNVKKITTTKRKKTSDLTEKSQEVTSTERWREIDDETSSNRSYTVRRHGETEKTDQALQHSFPTDVRHVVAATKIQAAWRGFHARWKDPKVVEIRHEIRSRRSEQYISLLCHELQMVKEKQETERRMRELQTEAIRFMWAQIRQLQQKLDENQGITSARRSKSSNGSLSPKRKNKDSQSGSRSPRRKSSSSPRVGQKGKVADNSKGTVTAKKATTTETESVLSSSWCGETVIEQPTPSAASTVKKADVSWRDDADASIFHVMPAISANRLEMRLIADDTDEGRGSLTTEGAGVSDSDAKNVQEDEQLKDTVKQLQQQVLQLQCALLSFSDKLVSEEHQPTEINGSQVEDSIEQNTSSSIKDVTVEPNNLLDASEIRVGSISPIQQSDLHIKLDDTCDSPSSARNIVSKLSLQEILTAIDCALSEVELWSICKQACVEMHKKGNPIKFFSVESLYMGKDGRVMFDEGSQTRIDDMYMSPEITSSRDSKPTFKSWIFSLSVALWCAADYKMKEAEAPCFSKDFESLLVAMSNDDVEQRADLEQVIQMCDAYHSSAQCNSLEVLSSLFAEARDFRQQRGRTDNHHLMREIITEERQQTQLKFRSQVAPGITDFSFQLKPAEERQLAARPDEEQTPHDLLMGDIKCGAELRNSPKPRMFTVRKMFEEDPSLLHKINILPGQRRKNMKALQLAVRRQQPGDPHSPPRPGIPTPPRALRAELKSQNETTAGESSNNCSIILRWHPSHIYDKQGNELNNEKVIGYRIYVNEQPKGMVAGGKSRALLDGLHRSCEYKISVHAVSALGESDPSNTVLVYVPQASQESSNEQMECQFAEKRDDDILPAESNAASFNRSVPEHKNLDKKLPPKASIKLCAVFPKQTTSPSKTEQHSPPPKPETPLNNSSDSWTTALSNEDGKTLRENSLAATSSDDIVDRVLRRYGIQKKNTATEVMMSSTDKAAPAPSSGNCAAGTNDVTTDDEAVTSVVSEETSNSGSNVTTNTNGDNITPRSKALLDQLKDELLM